MEKCSTFFRGHGHIEPKDENGCIKDRNHYDAHEFIDGKGRRVQWEYDYGCTCGCWDDEDYHGCMIYTIL